MKTMNYALIKAEQKIRVLVLYKWVPSLFWVSPACTLLAFIKVTLTSLNRYLYSYFEKGCRNEEKVHATIPNTVPDTVAVESTFVAFL